MSGFRFAVIGAGSFGRHHVRHLSQHPAVAAVTVVDADPDRARDIARQFGANTAKDATALDIDGAVVTVPTEQHASVAVTLLRKGIACFVEKPIAGSVRDGERILRAAEEGGTAVQVGHIERYSPAFEALQGACRNVRHVTARRHNPPRGTAPSACVVLDLMIHDIDLALTLVGSRVAHVEAFAPDGVGQEAAVAALTFTNGARADLSASRLAPKVDRTIEAHGDHGFATADLHQKTASLCADGKISELAVDGERDSLRAEIGSFIDVLSGRSRPRVGGQAALDALAVAERIRSAIAPAPHLNPLRLTA